MEAVSLSPSCLLSDAQPIEPPKISHRLEMPLLCLIVAPAAQPGEKRGVETVGDGVSSPIGWHGDCVWAKSERFDSDVRCFAAPERPSSNAIRMEQNFAA
jgi:hypothetical protein